MPASDKYTSMYGLGFEQMIDAYAGAYRRLFLEQPQPQTVLG